MLFFYFAACIWDFCFKELLCIQGCLCFGTCSSLTHLPLPESCLGILVLLLLLLQAQVDYERRLQEEVELKQQKEKEIAELVSIPCGAFYIPAIHFPQRRAYTHTVQCG